jgi:hypothetical protein
VKATTEGLRATFEIRIEAHSKAEVYEAFRRVAFAPEGLTLTTEEPKVWRVNNLSWCGVWLVTTKPDEDKSNE